MPLCRSTHPPRYGMCYSTVVSSCCVFRSCLVLIAMLLPVRRAFEPAEGSYLVRTLRSRDPSRHDREAECNSTPRPLVDFIILRVLTPTFGPRTWSRWIRYRYQYRCGYHPLTSSLSQPSLWEMTWEITIMERWMPTRVGIACGHESTSPCPWSYASLFRLLLHAQALVCLYPIRPSRFFNSRGDHRTIMNQRDDLVLVHPGWVPYGWFAHLYSLVSRSF